MIEVIRVPASDATTCDEIFRIRNQVFVEEQQVGREEEFDAFEQSSIHYLGSIDGIPAGTARCRITEKGFKLERFAVLPAYRKRGLAAAILKQVLTDFRAPGIFIYLHAQVTAMGFYEKYGFKKKGPMFTEANIDHFMMYDAGMPVT